ncbi:MAG: DNA polymerase subunit beta [Catenulispora sp.]|nr:DNA polymerase subunit beta [Catenulispora sp.]
MHDVVIVGSGPGGLATALAVRDRAPGARIALIEAGHAHRRRPCPVDNGRTCKGCGGMCNVISGFGGCMHYGDGVKLSLYPSGRRLGELLGEDRAQALSERAFAALTDRLGDRPVLRGQEIPGRMEVSFGRRGMQIRPYPVATIGEGTLSSIIDDLYEDLAADVDVLVDHDVVEVTGTGTGWTVVVRDRRGRTTDLDAWSVVLATGRRGLTSTQDLMERNGVRMHEPAPSVGVRFEMRSSLLREVGLGHPDLKVSRTGDGRKTKSFCFCGGGNGGRIKYTNYQTAFGLPIITLDGHETLDRAPAADRELAGNFGLMCQLPPAGQARDSSFQEHLFAKYRQISDGHPVVETLRSFVARTPESRQWPELAAAIPFEPSVRDLRTGPVHELLTEEQHSAIVTGFRELMEPIMDVAGEEPDITRLLDEVLVLGLEVEFLWNRVELSEHAETNVRGLYVVGDAAGYAQGIIQAMMLGFAAGEHIAVDRVAAPAVALA